MLGPPGHTKGWLEIEAGDFAGLLANPAVLTGVAGMMAQLARQHEVKEIAAYLAWINEKLDDLHRKQRDEVLARLDGIGRAVREASTVVEHGGHLDTVWSKVESTSGAILETQAYALRQRDAHAEKLELKSGMRELKIAVREADGEVGVWLTVLARCFQLQEEVAILELERVFHGAPDKLDGHRTGLWVAREEWRVIVLQNTRNLMSRLNSAARTTNLDVLLHAPEARAIVDAVNHVGAGIDEFHEPLGIDPTGNVIRATRLRDAVRDPEQWKDAGKEAGPAAAVGGAVGAVGVLFIHPRTRPYAMKIIRAAAREGH